MVHIYSMYSPYNINDVIIIPSKEYIDVSQDKNTSAFS